MVKDIQQYLDIIKQCRSGSNKITILENFNVTEFADGVKDVFNGKSFYNSKDMIKDLLPPAFWETYLYRHILDAILFSGQASRVMSCINQDDIGIRIRFVFNHEVNLFDRRGSHNMEKILATFLILDPEKTNFINRDFDEEIKIHITQKHPYYNNSTRGYIDVTVPCLLSLNRLTNTISLQFGSSDTSKGVYECSSLYKVAISARQLPTDSGLENYAKYYLEGSLMDYSTYLIHKDFPMMYNEVGYIDLKELIATSLLRRNKCCEEKFSKTLYNQNNFLSKYVIQDYLKNIPPQGFI